MDTTRIGKSIIMLAHAFVGWALCGLTMGIGTALISMSTTLVIHAIAAPIIFGLISLFYFKKLHYTSPIQTAIVFVAFVVFMDVFIVALLIMKSFEMFTSILGTWLPFCLIFAATYFTGLYVKKSP